jgi:menaquinone-dependent protoporphyrinogen oxidase
MRVLVTAGSKHGATAELADRIARDLSAAGHDVVSLPPEQVTDLDGVDAVVLGSAVYVGRWTTSARELMSRLQDELTRRPVWLFSSGPVGDPPLPVEEPTDGAEALAGLGAREHRVFPGRIDRTRLAFGERTIVRALHVAEGDFRDLDEVTDWARSIAAQLHTMES